jgi:hypothetical protein
MCPRGDSGGRGLRIGEEAERAIVDVEGLDADLAARQQEADADAAAIDGLQAYRVNFGPLQLASFSVPMEPARRPSGRGFPRCTAPHSSARP